jgi:hypothetical protein
LIHVAKPAGQVGVVGNPLAPALEQRDVHRIETDDLHKGSGVGVEEYGDDDDGDGDDADATPDDDDDMVKTYDGY